MMAVMMRTRVTSQPYCCAKAAQTPAIMRLLRGRMRRVVTKGCCGAEAAMGAPQAGQKREEGSICFPQRVQNMGVLRETYILTYRQPPQRSVRVGRGKG